MGERPELLASCYQRCLHIMAANGLRTIAFPCISTGIYGYPNKPAAHIALGETRKWMEEHGDLVDRIVFCTFLPIDNELYKSLCQVYFPPER
jgi:O-acetyl-ADP-ribose deacetylase (regulator of RNase III)